MYRELAIDLFQHCRALPLYDFSRFSELSTDQLVEIVDGAAQLERSWLASTPRPARNAFVAEGKEASEGFTNSRMKRDPE